MHEGESKKKKTEREEAAPRWKKRWEEFPENKKEKNFLSDMLSWIASCATGAHTHTRALWLI